MSKLKHITIIIFALTIFFGCATHNSQFEGIPFEKHTTLNGTGFTQKRLDSLTSYIKNNLTTTSMLILKDGKILYQYGGIQDLSYLASCRKSILSMLYGKYVENGTIDLTQTIGETGIDEDKGLLEIEKSATVDHVVNSRSGVFYQPVNPGSDGENIYQELEEQLAIPLGFQDWNIKNQKKEYDKGKSRYPAYHMYISARDMAKIGQLMLNKGEWNSKQLVSRDWIEKITSTVTSTE